MIGWSVRDQNQDFNCAGLLALLSLFDLCRFDLHGDECFWHCVSISLLAPPLSAARPKSLENTHVSKPCSEKKTRKLSPTHPSYLFLQETERNKRKTPRMKLWTFASMLQRVSRASILVSRIEPAQWRIIYYTKWNCHTTSRLNLNRKLLPSNKRGFRIRQIISHFELRSFCALQAREKAIQITRDSLCQVGHLPWNVLFGCHFIAPTLDRAVGA